MRELLRVPGIRLLLAGEITSTFGDWLLLLVLGMWAKTLTGSNTIAGAMALTFAAPSLASPLFGWVVDRFHRRPFLIAANVLSGAALLPLFLVNTRHDVWILYLAGIAYGISFSITGGAFAGLIKILVPDHLIGTANGAFSGMRQSFRLVGPLIGAGIFAAVGGKVVTLIDIVSFGVAALTLALIRAPQAPITRGELHWLHEIGAGVRHVWRVLALRRTTIAAGVAMLALGAVDTMIYAFIDQGLHRPPTFLGVMVTLQGIGAVLGAVSAPKLMTRLGEVAVVSIGLTSFGAALAVVVHPTLLFTLLIAMPLSGIGNGVTFVAFSTLMQRRTPGPLMGRVSAATDMVVGGAQTLSMVVGVSIVAVVSFRYVFGTIAVVLLALGGWLWLTRRTTGSAEPPVDGGGDAIEDLVTPPVEPVAPAPAG